MIVDDLGNVLVVERAASRVVLLSDEDTDGVASQDEIRPLAEANGLNHGLAISEGMLYASSETTVFRWPYTAGERGQLGTPETVISGLPAGGHPTRTLAFDAAGSLYVSVGSASNVDSDPSRARLLRYTAEQLEVGATFGEGELFADGLRNEVGLRFDDQGRLWGVENGLDNLVREDLGGDIHNDNPAEELNLFAEAGRAYGYPYCWSEFLLPEGVGEGPGAQWAHPDFQDDGVHDDAWCKDPDNVVPPVLALPAHLAPLDLLFYQGAAFPSDYADDLFVGAHGSWNRDPAIGYSVLRVSIGTDGMPTGEVTPFLQSSEADVAANWTHRPVALAVLSNGVLLVTSDASDQVIAIGYEGG